MGKPTVFLRCAGAVAAAWLLLLPLTSVAQIIPEDFPTGAAAQAWSKWQPAMQAILERNNEQAEALFAELLAMDPSAFRIALLADRTVNRTALGGAVLLFGQDAEAGALGESGARVAELLETGREQMNQANDGWYFSLIGRFDIGQANFAALLESDPDPVALLEFTDREPRRRDILLQLSDNPVVGESARRLLRLLDVGEERIKADPTRIRTHIERLAGPPRGFQNAVAYLQQAGEYAVPFMIQYLRDPATREYTQPILRALPMLGRPALNPLVIAGRMDDQVVRRYVVESLGEIGYPQAVPYLLRILANENVAQEIVEAVQKALAAIRQRGFEAPRDQSPAQAFFELAEDYYADQPSLAADPRLDTASVWYWRDQLLQNIFVPTPIFNEIMTMRCCEEALLLDPQHQAAQALWVAANFRREAQLPEGAEDTTRPPNYPPALYFAQTSGPAVCLRTLARALADGDPAVALGAIEALRATAGPATLIADNAEDMPLAQALSFPDRMVRIRAALTLGAAQPQQRFHNYQNLMPVLSEAVMLFGGARTALVIDPDEAAANALAALLREDGFDVISDTGFTSGLQKARETSPSLDVVVLGSDLRDVPLPNAVQQLRDEFRFGSTPMLIVAKPGTRDMVANLVSGDHRLAQVQPNDPPDAVRAALERISRSVGVMAITPERGTALSQEAVDVLLGLADSRSQLFNIAAAETALIAALGSENEQLRITAAKVLGYIPSRAAQEAIAAIALAEAEPKEMRITMFGALADAAKRSGNQLGEETIAALLALAQNAEDLEIRTAASETVGALNLPTDIGSEIIRNQYGG